MSALLAFLPLYDPLYALYPGMSDYWLWLVIPLAVAISVVYKGTRVDKLASLPKEAAIMCTQMLVAMTLAATLLALGYWGYVFWFGPLVH